VLSVPELAEWLRRWIEHMRLVRPVLVANSMGCQIVVELAALAPEMVRAAVMLGPTMDPSGGVLGQVGRLFLDQFREPMSLVPLQAFDYIGNGPIRTIGTFREAIKQRMIDRAALLRAPTLILRGERDPIVSDWFVRELARRIPNAQLQIIAGAGHALNYNSPGEVARCVTDFIGEICGIA
jgi:pimeloyl-ACP methyl ester carboxylesterase